MKRFVFANSGSWDVFSSFVKVAEAAKVIENCQRDLNIALVNELSGIFETMHLDTMEVLNAAGSKWNFLPFKPNGGWPLHRSGSSLFELQGSSQWLST